MADELLRITDRAEADRIVETVLRGAQKARSNLIEAGHREDVLAATAPMLFGPRNVVTLCADALTRRDEPDHERCLFASNLVVIARTVCLPIGMACDLSAVGGQLPDPSWLR